MVAASMAVAESRGFREAARRLHVVQPALSQTVSDLEQELGVTLLVRNSRAVRLTAPLNPGPLIGNSFVLT